MPFEFARRAQPLWLATALLVATAVTAVNGGGVAAAPGDSRAEPVPFGEPAAAGPWRLTVVEVVSGEDATALVTGASAANAGPRDGFTYVLVRLRAENTGDHPLAIQGDDFGLSGASGQVRRFAGAIAPAPALDAVVAPGESTEGWVVLGAPVDEASRLLLYDPLALSGNWADRVFALEAGAAVPGVAAAAEPNQIGANVGAPAEFNEPVVTDEWQVETLELLEGAAIFELVDFRTAALGVNESVNVEDPWLALRVRITYVGEAGEPAFLPPTAFTVVDANGSSALDVLRLTPPYPDVSAFYYPGASREGLVIFELTDDYLATGLSLVRFQPLRTDPDPRFFTWGSAGG